jgi:hypothetical protein
MFSVVLQLCPSLRLVSALASPALRASRGSVSAQVDSPVALAPKLAGNVNTVRARNAPDPIVCTE